MKRYTILLFFILTFIAAFILGNTHNLNDKVTSSVNIFGTLTISGSGALSSTKYSKKTFFNNKIRKIVIKEGITSIPEYAFKGCTNVTSVIVDPSVKKIGQSSFSTPKVKSMTVPGSFELIKENQNWDTIECVCSSKFLKKVTFNSALDPIVCTYFNTKNFVTYAKDTKFKSYGGIIYTKDGKELVRVPYKRRNVVIRKGCTDIDLWALTYCSCAPMEEIYYCKVKRLTIPKSVIRINKSNYPGSHEGDNVRERLTRIKIKSKQLTGRSISILTTTFYEISLEEYASIMPTQIQKSGDFYIADDGINGKVLLSYEGEDEQVTIPSDIKIIGIFAFSGSVIKNVKLPEGLVEIMPYAFEVCFNMKEIDIPETCTAIGECAFMNGSLKELTIPAAVTSFGHSIISSHKVTSITMKSLPKDCPTDLFSEVHGDTVVYFPTNDADYKNYFTAPSIHTVSYADDTATIYFCWNNLSGIDGYQVKISMDKNFPAEETDTMTFKGSVSSGSFGNIPKNQKLTLYLKIRPYKIIDGKKIYGRWATDSKKV